MSEPTLIEVHLPALRVSALAWGDPDGPLVVLLHGFPDTPWSWRHLGPHLADLGHRVVAPFSRGYAPTAVPADGCVSIGALMADAVALHAALGGDERAVLVGHDWGAITANALGAHPSSPYARVVSLSVPPLSLVAGAGPVLLARQLRMSWYILFNQLPVLPELLTDRLVARLWRDWSPAYDGAADVSRVLAALPTRAHRAAVIGYYRALRWPWGSPARYRDWQRTFDGVPTVPMLYLHGADDGCLQAALAQRAAARMPATASVRIVPGAGHFLQVERPEEVNELIGAFIGAVD